MFKRTITKRKVIYSLLALSAFAFLLLVFCNLQVKYSTSPYLYNSVAQTPHNKVGLLLGTSKRLSNGRSNGYFANRIEATVELYKAGKIDKVIISGDNGSRYYNEPKDMKEALIKGGMPPEAIYMDFAGFRTFDSVIRSKEIFGQSQITIISQRFHNARAVFIARHYDIDAIGYNAKDVNKYAGIKTNLRELLARVKLFVDIFITNAQPKFLGDKIQIK